MLLPLVTPELVFAVGMFLLFTTAFGFIGLGTTAQAIGQVTFTLSWVVLIVRGRLVTIGGDIEEAAADLGAPPVSVVRRVLLPLLVPAMAASLLVAFALSIDDFVVSAVHGLGRGHDDGADAHLRQARGGADAGAERAGDDHAASFRCWRWCWPGSSSGCFSRGQEARAGARFAAGGGPVSRGRDRPRRARQALRRRRSRSTASTCTCPAASSSRCSARRAAARRRRCG